MRKKKVITQVNISRIMRNTLEEIEKLQGTDIETLIKKGKCIKRAKKITDLLLSKLLLEYGYPTTKENIEILRKTKVIKNAAEDTDLYCTIEELIFFLNNK